MCKREHGCVEAEAAAQLVHEPTILAGRERVQRTLQSPLGDELVRGVTNGVGTRMMPDGSLVPPGMVFRTVFRRVGGELVKSADGLEAEP